MIQLVESARERGVITLATIRQKVDGRYEFISGHRRERACELTEFETLRSNSFLEGSCTGRKRTLD